MGDIDYLRAELFERSHKRLQRSYWNSTEGKKSVLNEVINEENRRISTGTHIQEKNTLRFPVHEEKWQERPMELIGSHQGHV